MSILEAYLMAVIGEVLLIILKITERKEKL